MGTLRRRNRRKLHSCCTRWKERRLWVTPKRRSASWNSGKVRYFFKDTPVEAIHPQAFKAAEAALCAEVQGQYWAMHDRLFSNQHSLAVEDLGRHASALRLDE